MAESTKRLVEIAIKANTGGAETSIEGLIKKMTGLSKQQMLIGAAAITAGALIAKAFASATMKAAVFQKSMAEVRTLTGASVADSAKLSKEIQNLSAQFGQLDSAMSKASYNVVSAGFGDIAEQTTLLAVASKAAIAGVTDVNTAAKVITQTLNAYKLEAADANWVSDILFATVKGGVTTFEELSGSLGKVNSIASTAGISFDEVAAAMAVLTKNGLNSEEAATALRGLIIAIGAASGDSKDKLDKLGITLDKGLAPALAAINKAGGKSIGTLRELVPDTRALNAAASAGANGAKQLTDQLVLMAKAAGSTDDAFKVMDGTVAQAEARLIASKKRLQDIWGSEGLGIASTYFETMTDFVNGVAIALEAAAEAGDKYAVKLSLVQRLQSDIANRPSDKGQGASGNGQFDVLMFGMPGADGGPTEYKGSGQSSSDIDKRTAALRKENEEWRAQLVIMANLALQNSLLVDAAYKSTDAAYFYGKDADGVTDSYGTPSDADQAAAAMVPSAMSITSAITDEDMAKWKKMNEAAAEFDAAVQQSLAGLAQGFADVGAQGVSSMLGLREGAFMMGDALKGVVAQALEAVISKLILIKLINPFMGFLGLADGGTVPGMAAGGMIPIKAAAGMVVPNMGRAGFDSVPIMAMPGEGVIKRDTMQRLESFLNANANAPAASVDAFGPGSPAGGTTVNYNISRPVSWRDHLDLGDNAVAASRAASRRVL